MSRRSDLSKFGDKMDEFFNVLKTAFPGDMDLEKYHDKLSVARRVNPRMVCEGFLKVVKMPANPNVTNSSWYLHHIMAGDDHFFVQLDLRQIVDPNYHGLIEKITELWLSMTSASQSAIKRYLQILVTLSAIAMKDVHAIEQLNQIRSNAGKKLIPM